MSQVPASSSENPAQSLLELIFSAVQGRALLSMVELRIADHLQTQALSCAELAKISGNDPMAMLRLLSLLKQLHLLNEDKEGRYQCTEKGRLLAENNSSGFCNYAKLTNSEVVMSMLQHMPSALESGESVFNKLHGRSFYQALQERPEDAAVFNGAMHEISRQDIPEILDAYDFSEVDSIADIGGGQGFLLAALLSRYPSLKASLMELEDVAESAQQQLLTFSQQHRCEIAAGDFLEAVPVDADIYILKRVLSHCTDEDAERLLANIRQRIKGNGKVLLIDPETESLYGASYNLLMLTVLGGKGVRKLDELQSLLDKTGFRFQRKLALETELCIIELEPV